MGVDSGLPDFRGNEGFWKAYPPFRHLGLSFVDLADPRWFRDDPERAWGFYGHRRNLYRQTTPHAGFDILLEWGKKMACGYFVYTSNVDNQFQKAGFAAERVVECHGSLEHLQCTRPCSREIWPAEESAIAVDEDTIRASEPLPRCRQCNALARPNILMFGDMVWQSRRTRHQARALDTWLGEIAGQPLAIVECGAGTAIPSVRYECERGPGTLIRVNPREFQVPEGGISLRAGALDALTRIDSIIIGR